MEKKCVAPFNPNEYCGAGFAFESLQPNKTARIKFRGYLQRNNEPQLHYVHIRFLCLFFSKTFDHQILCNDTLLGKEASISHRSSTFNELLENKIEQLCQIKGTFKVDDREEEELFFLATVGRRFGPNGGDSPYLRKIVKLFGFDQKGFAFQIGYVRVGTHSYRYGFMSQGDGTFKLLKFLTLTVDTLASKINADTWYFEALFKGEPTKFEFMVCKIQDSNCFLKSDDNRRTVVINGVEGI